MPRRELREPLQVVAWLEDWGRKLVRPGSLILIGSGGLLWHAAQRGLDAPLPSNSMDVDPITDDEEVAKLCYESLIGSPFELEHGWHVNLMPHAVLRQFPASWLERALVTHYGHLTVTVPEVADLLAPKLGRGEPRDLAHAQWAREHGLL
jgi:hypothetical protein